MTFWDWLHRLGPGWPNERGWVTVGIFVMAGSLFKMAEVHPLLWDVELFKALLTLVVGTGLINMILAFHFTANKGSETRAENTNLSLQAIRHEQDKSAALLDAVVPTPPSPPPTTVVATLDTVPADNSEAIRAAIADAIEDGVLVEGTDVKMWSVDEGYPSGQYVVHPVAGEPLPRIYRAVNDVPPGIALDNMTFWALVEDIE